MPCRKFIAYQQQRPGKDRGPHLAELELQCRLLARRDAAAKEGRGMMDLLVDYFERFGSKPCCMTDLKLYVSSLESSERDEFFSRTAECISLADKGIPSTVRLLRICICILIVYICTSGQAYQALFQLEGGGHFSLKTSSPCV